MFRLLEAVQVVEIMFLVLEAVHVVRLFFDVAPMSLNLQRFNYVKPCKSLDYLSTNLLVVAQVVQSRSSPQLGISERTADIIYNFPACIYKSRREELTEWNLG